MSFTITAEFPLGFYQGRNPAGQVEDVPTPVRLLSALTAAAGMSGQTDGRQNSPGIAAGSQAALEWLANNPPDQIALPERIVNDPGIIAYKVLGLRDKDRFSSPVAREAIARSSLNGPVHWRWSSSPPPEVTQALQGLLMEVPYLGEAVSLVSLRATTDSFELSEPYVLLDAKNSGDRSPEAIAVPVPDSDRPRVLEELHRELNKAGNSNPSVKDEKEVIARWPNQGIRQLWYEPRRIVSEQPNPWSEAFILEVRSVTPGVTAWPPKHKDYVRWCVALHRTLVRAAGLGAPPMVTGRYEPGSERPANNVAAQILHRTDTLNHNWAPDAEGAFAVLIPAGAPETDRSAAYLAVAALLDRTVRPSRTEGVTVIGIHHLTAQEFWRAPAADHKRFRVTRPLAIADTRPLRLNALGQTWTLHDAVSLSVGMTWRDHFTASGKGESLYRALAHQASANIQVIGDQRVHDAELHRYVHRVQPSNVITAYRALIDAGPILADTAPASIGQSRHFGGGMLVPLDVPLALLDENGVPLWH